MTNQTKTKYKGQRLGNWELTSLALSVPSDVMGVTQSARTVLLEICFQQTFSDKGPQGGWFIYNADIATATGVDVKTVSRSTEALENAGLVTVNRGGRYDPNSYSVNVKQLEHLALQQSDRVNKLRESAKQASRRAYGEAMEAGGEPQCGHSVPTEPSSVDIVSQRTDRMSHYLEANLEANLEATVEAVLDTSLETNLEASDDGKVLADSINATEEQGQAPSASSLAEVSHDKGSSTSPSSSVEINTADSLEDLPDGNRIVELGAVGEEIHKRLQSETKRKPWNQDTPVPEFLSGQSDAKIEMFRQAKKVPLSGNNLTDDKLAFCVANGVEADIK